MKLPQGKISETLLARWLRDVGKIPEESGVAIGPGIGRDAAVVEAPKGDLIVVASDPISFTSDRIGEYLITINANDIATTGAVSRWFLATVLLPVRTSEDRAERVLSELSSACQTFGIALVGGHTEISNAVNRIVISGTMLGTVAPDRLIDRSGVGPGQAVLITKAIAIEGASILAMEYRDLLLDRGVLEITLRTARSFIDSLSIVPEARLAVASGKITAFHDVTEGGVVTALGELAVSAGLEIDLDLIPILPECRQICDALEIDPLGLVGSGSLLIVCKEDDADGVAVALDAESIRCTRIGTVIGDEGVKFLSSGLSVDPPRFAVDEIARLASQ